MPNPEFELVGRDGARLFARCWEPRGPVSGAVCIAHGLGEHSGRYGAFADRLRGDGYLVLACDHRGHGRSAGQRGHVADYALLLDDLESLLRVAENSAASPAFLFGHSLGGNLVLNLVLRRSPPLAGVIASGPLLLPGMPIPQWKVLAGRIADRLVPRLAFDSGVDPRDLARDPEVVRAYETDPLIHRRVSARLGVQMLDAGRWALEHAGQLAIPALLMHGGADTVTSPLASAEFARRAGSRCTLRIWEGQLHDLHQDRDRNAVIASMLDWMAAVPGAAQDRVEELRRMND